jgi:hypothetical protein
MYERMQEHMENLGLIGDHDDSVPEVKVEEIIKK